MGNVYEIIDSTDEDSYYLLGCFVDKQEAIDALTQAAIDSDGTDEGISYFNDNDNEVIEVIEITLGWRTSRKSVFEVVRERVHSEESGSWLWRTEAIK